MRIAFGSYSFKLKSYSSIDLGLNESEWKNSEFEVRQNVFHLFWIPFFSLGKIYVIKKQGEKYDLPEHIIQKIRNKGKIRTPWYSFLLPIMLLVIPAFVGIYIYFAESIMRNNNYNEDKKIYKLAIGNLQSEMQKLSKNAYLRIVNLEKPNDDKILLKLIDINDSEYSFIAKKIHFPKYSNEKYYFEKFRDDTLIYSKNELQKAICEDYDIIKNHKSYGLEFFNKEKYIIENIEYFDMPVIDGRSNWDFLDVIRNHKFEFYNVQFSGSQNERSWKFKLRFQNFGIPVNLVQIQNIENEVEWNDSLPIKFKSYEYLKDIEINASTKQEPETLKFKSKFIFKDSLNNKYEFTVKGNKSKFEINRE